MSNQFIKTKTGYVILCNAKEYQEFKDSIPEGLNALIKQFRADGGVLDGMLLDQFQALWFLVEKGLLKINQSEPIYEKMFLFLEVTQKAQSPHLVREMSTQEWQSYLSLLTQVEKLH